MIFARLYRDTEVSRKEDTAKFGDQFFPCIAFVAPLLPIKVSVEAGTVHRPMNTFMRERPRVRFSRDERLKGRHLNEVAGGMIKRPVAAMADVSAKIGEKAIGGIDALYALTVCRLALNRGEVLRQAVDLVGVENTVPLHERDTPLDLFTLLVGLRPLNRIGVDDKRALLTLAHIAAQFLVG